MKARYFPNNEFLEASLGQNPSYMWRSILAAQGIVKQRCRKKIGNGDNTMVWEVPWLPCEENAFLTSNMPEQLKHITVRSLMMQQENKWDDDILNDICNDRDVVLIKRIPLPAFDKQDSRVWLFDDKGVFTVKSCYRKLQGEHNISHGAFWKKLWATKLPGNVVNFMWRACNSCLPTAVALVTKRVQMDIKCPWCRTENEDAIHVLFTCSFARLV